MNRKQVNLKCANQRESLQVECVQGKRSQTTETQNREYKSDVFSMLMEDAGNALQVYNALNGSAYDDPTMVEFNTLEKGISLSVRNDASFIVDMYLNIYEHQSTYNPNMPLRSLIYLTDILKKLVKKRDLLGRKLIQIPTPHFIVFYNGVEELPAVSELKLSDAFFHKTDEPQLELKCTVYNINSGMNDSMLARCQVLREYMEFVEKVRELKSNDVEDFVEAAVDWCVENDVLKEFLLARKDEVIKNMTIDMTFERRVEIIRAEEREEGREEGRESILISLAKDGYIDIDVAASKAGLTSEEFRKLMNQM